MEACEQISVLTQTSGMNFLPSEQAAVARQVEFSFLNCAVRSLLLLSPVPPRAETCILTSSPRAFSNAFIQNSLSAPIVLPSLLFNPEAKGLHPLLAFIFTG